MYFDAVINEKYEPLFNGTPEETKKWLVSDEIPDEQLNVVRGYDMRVLTVSEYLEK
jgi:hypothetical protein